MDLEGTVKECDGKKKTPFLKKNPAMIKKKKIPPSPLYVLLNGVIKLLHFIYWPLGVAKSEITDLLL